MSFTPNTLAYLSFGYPAGVTAVDWAYTSISDALGEIRISGYFNEVSNKFIVNQNILVTGSDGQESFRVTAVSPNVTVEETLGAPLVTHVTTWGGAFSTPITGGDIIISKIGRQVVAIFNSISGTADTATTISALVPIPNALHPENAFGSPNLLLPVQDNTVDKVGKLIVSATDGSVTVFASEGGASFAGAGATGFAAVPLTWISNVP